jgi:hypothetical protein
MDETKQIEAAAVTVHWPNGPVNVCIDHATKLKALGAFLGTHIGITPYSSIGPDGELEPCINCVNEAKIDR